jgi:hypothetical protein
VCVETFYHIWGNQCTMPACVLEPQVCWWLRCSCRYFIAIACVRCVGRSAPLLVDWLHPGVLTSGLSVCGCVGGWAGDS